MKGYGREPVQFVGCAMRTKGLWLALVRTAHPTSCLMHHLIGT
ncbi:hypothetical protein SAMN05216190_12747 [Pseudomonas borbori]|uniref:Uncharacterized protein n=1 Tax=Pseudomonas borbori TaxID=289003 RepID=A0A1I5UVC5_9PSED|nr:hypothetical protein SAMN05216190_12747 [Pseudomonas borbori]